MNIELDNMPRRERLQLLRAREADTRAHILLLFPEEQAAITQWTRTLPVALILGGPRTGTSAVRASLASHDGVLAPAGEHRLFFTLLGLNFPDAGNKWEAGNELLSPSAIQQVFEMIFLACGHGAQIDLPDEREALRYAWDWAYRLPLQWTRLECDPEEIVRIVLRAVAEYRAIGKFDLTILDQLVLDRLASAYPPIDTQFYDGFPASEDRQHWTATLGRTFDPIIEITPFVVPRPRKLKTPDSNVQLLLLKASSDAYRLTSLRSLFAGHSLNILRLKRNPLATINGLLDGWLHHCFWQHDLSCSLGPSHPFAGWCFDLVDDWQRLAGKRDLLPIAARQWLEPNRLIEAARIAKPDAEHWDNVAFEDFVRSPESRLRLLTRSLKALGLEPDSGIGRAAIAPPQVNLTRPHATGRWRKRSAELLPLLENTQIAEMAEALGYDRRRIDEWL